VAEDLVNKCASVVFFLLVDSLECEFYVPTFWNSLFHLHRSVNKNLLVPK
jgi:hypothetical protein